MAKQPRTINYSRNLRKKLHILGKCFEELMVDLDVWLRLLEGGYRQLYQVYGQPDSKISASDKIEIGKILAEHGLPPLDRPLSGAFRWSIEQEYGLTPAATPEQIAEYRKTKDLLDADEDTFVSAVAALDSVRVAKWRTELGRLEAKHVNILKAWASVRDARLDLEAAKADFDRTCKREHFPTPHLDDAIKHGEHLINDLRGATDRLESVCRAEQNAFAELQKLIAHEPNSRPAEFVLSELKRRITLLCGMIEELSTPV